MSEIPVHLVANLDPKLQKYVVSLTGEGETIQRTMSPDEFTGFAEMRDEWWDGLKLAVEGDDGVVARATFDKVQKARMREYLELVLEGGQRHLEGQR